MFYSLILLATLAAASSEMPAPATVVRMLSEVPNTTIRYYDVTGRDVTSINRSIARQRSKDPGDRAAPASTDWIVKAAFERRTVNGECKVTNARASFTATADLPRLIDEQSVDPPVLARWRKYIASLQESEMAALVFVYSHLDEVEEQIVGSRCEDATAAVAAAIERLQRRAAAFEFDRQRTRPKLFGMAEENARPAKAICKDLIGTGSRLNTLRICMTPGEWAKLQRSGEQATREMQDKPRPNRPF